VKPEDRKPKLREYMQKINYFLNHTRKKFREDENSFSRKNKLVFNLFEGIILPFPPSEKPFAPAETSKFHSNSVVRIIEDECQVFNTRKRVPYKIVLETIEYY